MAFVTSRLREIGGFDPQFRSAGDDVDLCWRLQERGFSIGFCAAAMVWHHRRGSLRAYWRQQRGYGRAEALLERKWPEKYNALGHASWAGRVYAGCLAALSAIMSGSAGLWGSTLQALYQPGRRACGALPDAGGPSVIGPGSLCARRSGRRCSGPAAAPARRRRGAACAQRSPRARRCAAAGPRRSSAFHADGAAPPDPAARAPCAVGSGTASPLRRGARARLAAARVRSLWSETWRSPLGARRGGRRSDGGVRRRGDALGPRGARLPRRRALDGVRGHGGCQYVRLTGRASGKGVALALASRAWRAGSSRRRSRGAACSEPNCGDGSGWARVHAATAALLRRPRVNAPAVAPAPSTPLLRRLARRAPTAAAAGSCALAARRRSHCQRRSSRKSPWTTRSAGSAPAFSAAPPRVFGAGAALGLAVDLVSRRPVVYLRSLSLSAPDAWRAPRARLRARLWATPAALALLTDARGWRMPTG
jgi:hypothetical protein